MSVMGKVGLAFAVGSLAVGSVSGAGAAHAGGLHGAIALSESTWSYGSGVDWPSFPEALDAAMESCAEPDCQIMISWADGCAAMVYTEDGIAAASGRNRAEAERNAYQLIGQLTPTAPLANVGSAALSGARIFDVICTSNAR